MKYAALSSYDIKTKIAKLTPVIFPVGAVEAHGPHLPLETDNLLAEKYSDKLADRVNGLVLPLLPFGQVWSLKNFPGSITLSNQTVASLVYEIGESLYRQGFRIFVMISGHLGNMTALKEGARELYEQFPEMKVLYIFYPDIQKLAKDVRESPSSHATYIHACEIETSLLLYLDEERVDMEKAIKGTPNFPLDADYTPTPWEKATDTAVLSDATLATVAKGEYLIEKTLDKCVEMVENAQREIAQQEKMA